MFDSISSYLVTFWAFCSEEKHMLFDKTTSNSKVIIKVVYVQYFPLQCGPIENKHLIITEKTTMQEEGKWPHRKKVNCKTSQCCWSVERSCFSNTNILWFHFVPSVTNSMSHFGPKEIFQFLLKSCLFLSRSITAAICKYVVLWICLWATICVSQTEIYCYFQDEFGCSEILSCEQHFICSGKNLPSQEK